MWFRKKKSCYPQVWFHIDGNKYRWYGWLGCQLESIESSRVPAGTTRYLDLGVGKGIEIRVYQTERCGICKFRTTWAISSTGTYGEYSERVSNFHKTLQSLV